MITLEDEKSSLSRFPKEGGVKSTLEKGGFRGI